MPTIRRAPNNGDVAVPTLILIGALDEAAPPRVCHNMMARRTGAGAPLRLIVYPDAHHGFDMVSLRQPVSSFGHRLQYNEAAANAAWADTLAALKEAFGR